MEKVVLTDEGAAVADGSQLTVRLRRNKDVTIEVIDGFGGNLAIINLSPATVARLVDALRQSLLG